MLPRTGETFMAMSNLPPNSANRQPSSNGQAAESLLRRDQQRRDALPPPHPHDPHTCGLSYALSCPECQGAYYRDAAAQLYGAEALELAIERWHALRLAHASLLGDACTWEQLYPEPVTPQQLAAAVGTLLWPPYRQLLREILLDLLGTDIAAIALGIKEKQP
jgi:hypothetical protein